MKHLALLSNGSFDPIWANVSEWRGEFWWFNEIVSDRIILKQELPSTKNITKFN